MKVHGNQRHGYARRGKKTLAYKAWESMIRRCTMPSQYSYKYYGGCGIVVCERWRNFVNFLADMGERPDGMTLDRIDPKGNYEPRNCRWADMKTQMRNKTNNRLVTYHERTQPLVSWAEELGIKPKTLRARLFDYKMTVEEAFTRPVRCAKPPTTAAEKVLI